MKKIFTLVAIAAFALSFSLTSCSKSAEDYAKEKYDLKEKLKNEEDKDKKAELEKQYDELMDEIHKKRKEDPEFDKAYEEALQTVEKEAAE